jgi:MSHA biogenesis protein MshI
VRGLLNLWRKNSATERRTALVETDDGCAIATTERIGGGRFRLLACRSVDAAAAARSAILLDWLAADLHRFGAVGTVLDSVDYQLLLVESPDVLPAEMKAAVRWRLKDSLDFPVEEAVVDVFNIPEPARRTGSKMTYAIAAKSAGIARHAALLKSHSRRFDVIDIPELALRNLAAQLPEAADGLIFLWLNAASAQLLVIKGRTLYLARDVPFSTRRDPGGPDELRNVQAIALELQRSMDYFESHYEQAPISHLIIAPPDRTANILAEQLASQTAMRIQALQMDRVLELPAELPTPDRRCLLAIGAALRTEQRQL